MCYFKGNMIVFVLSMILRLSLLGLICKVLEELLCCFAAVGGPSGDSWEVLGDPWRLGRVLLRAFWGTSRRIWTYLHIP